tara:strand:- start:29391 stop:30137 length:747 start_codon:yes stop_codon:yes gene_type:complete
MIFLGDTHGNNSHIMYMIKTNKKIQNQQIIHVGDFGVGFNKPNQEIKNLQHLNKFLKERNVILHVFRGNHDDPAYFSGSHIYSNLKLHKDYTVLEIEGKRILGIGGAVSIDRTSRWEYENSWWSLEKFFLDVEKLEEVRDIDILVTHTTPSEMLPIVDGLNFPPIVMRFANVDMGLLDDLVFERNQLSEMLEILLKNNKITNHFYGHFHRHLELERDGCKHICLDISEFYELVDYTDYEKELNEKYGS